MNHILAFIVGVLIGIISNLINENRKQEIMKIKDIFNEKTM